MNSLFWFFFLARGRCHEHRRFFFLFHFFSYFGYVDLWVTGMGMSKNQGEYDLAFN